MNDQTKRKKRLRTNDLIYIFLHDYYSSSRIYPLIILINSAWRSIEELVFHFFSSSLLLLCLLSLGQWRREDYTRQWLEDDERISCWVSCWGNLIKQIRNFTLLKMFKWMKYFSRSKSSSCCYRILFNNEKKFQS